MAINILRHYSRHFVDDRYIAHVELTFKGKLYKASNSKNDWSRFNWTLLQVYIPEHYKGQKFYPAHWRTVRNSTLTKGGYGKLIINHLASHGGTHVDV